MNELIKTNQNDDGEIIVSGRELHKFLEVKTKYADWFERMCEYGFIENVDYIEFWSDPKNENAQLSKDEAAKYSSQKLSALGCEKHHALKLDMAKEISMIQRNEKGKEARQYFIKVEKRYKQGQPQFNSLEVALQAALQHEQAIKEIKTDVTYLKDNMRIGGTQQQEIQQTANKSVVHALGGKESNAYRCANKKAFSEFWNSFKKYFKIPRYGDLRKLKFDEALRFINLWRPSTALQMEIDERNSQMDMPV